MLSYQSTVSLLRRELLSRQFTKSIFAMKVLAYSPCQTIFYNYCSEYLDVVSNIWYILHRVRRRSRHFHHALYILQVEFQIQSAYREFSEANIIQAHALCQNSLCREDGSKHLPNTKIIITSGKFDTPDQYFCNKYSILKLYMSSIAET